MKIMKIIFFYCILFGALSFTLITTLVGYQYQEDSKLYIIYNLLISFLGYSYFLKKVFINKKRVSWDIIVIIIMVLSYFYSVVLFNNDSLMAFNFWTYMIIWSIPAYLYGVVFSEECCFRLIWESIDIFMILLTIVILKNAVYYYINGRGAFSVSGTTTYQTMSYLSALAFGLNYYLLIQENNMLRLKIFQKNLVYKNFCLVLMLVQLFSLIITGGRGGMVLAFVYFIVITCFIKKNINKNVKSFVVSSFIVIVLFLFTSNNTHIVIGLKRIFEFIGTSGINWEGTSGRKDVYDLAFCLINEKPVFGYGIWGLFQYTRNPHNMFLEMTLGGGVTLLSFGIILLSFILYKFVKIQKRNTYYQILLIFFLYNFVMLMFSGTYLCAPTIWFFIAVIIKYKFKRIYKKPFLIKGARYERKY